MKHCPQCNFSFPDVHRVCDFDGTELVSDPEPRSLVRVRTSPRPSRFRHTLTSPMLWAGVLLMAVVASAFLVAYYDATNQSPRVAKARPAPAAPAAMPAARTSDQSPALIQAPVAAKRGGVTGAQASRLHLKSRKSEIARRRDTQQISHEKEPRLTAMLKTTWRVIKKPFKF